MPLDLQMEITKDYKKQAFERDNGLCRYCGFDFLSHLSAFWSYEVDHVVARCVNGPDTLDNVVTCCGSCNRALSRAKHLATFEERKQYVLSQFPSRSVIFDEWRLKLRGENR